MGPPNPGAWVNAVNLATRVGERENRIVAILIEKVPVSAIRMLADILNQMAQGNAVSLVPIGHTLTTQQAADILNVSRPYLVKLLETGKIRFTKVGRHRRVKYQDLLEYMEQADAQSSEAANALSRQAQELGMGY